MWYKDCNQSCMKRTELIRNCKQEDGAMYLDEVYEPDEILMDVDAVNDFEPEDDLYELTFESEREAAEGYSLLLDDVGFPEALFAESR